MADEDEFADHRCVPRDSVDRLIADWADVRPELDFSPVAVISRLGRVRAHLDREVEELFARHGITGPGFAVLVTLARLEASGPVSQRRLMEELGLTSGTISVRIDRLAADGLVARHPAEDDRRNTRVTLTDAGRELFERIVPAHLDNERRLLAALSDSERVLLADVLRKLLVEFEGSAQPPGMPAPLGLTLSPAHVTVSMRAAVGLPAIAGLLVREVGDGPAGPAGVQVGDVLCRADSRALTSIGALRASIDAHPRGGRLRLLVARGAAELELDVPLAPRPDEGSAASASTGARGARDHHSV